MENSAGAPRPTEVPLAVVLTQRRIVLVLGLYTALTLWPYRGGQVLEGFLFLRPHLPSLAYYGAFFVLGYLVRGFPAFFETARRHAWRYALLAAALFGWVAKYTFQP